MVFVRAISRRKLKIEKGRKKRRFIRRWWRDSRNPEKIETQKKNKENLNAKILNSPKIVYHTL